MSNCDALVIGAGHNGLTCAAYLAMAGLRVRVVERRGVVGGAAVTEEFHPGFRNSVASYTVGLLNPEVIRDLRLHDHGLRIVPRQANNFVPAADGRFLLTRPDHTAASIASISPRDGERYGEYARVIDAVGDLLRPMLLRTPPNVTSGGPSEWVPEALKALGLGNALRRHGSETLLSLHALLTKSAGDYLDGWFESDLVKALFGFDAVVGHYASPYSPGSAYVQLHHTLGEIGGRKGVWGHAIGGMGAITQAMARSATSAGAEIRVEAPVRRVLVEDGRAVGAKLDDGEVIRARAVVANVNPKLLYGRLVEDDHLPAAFATAMKAYRCGSATFRMNVALSGLPRFSAVPSPGIGEHHTAGIILAPSLGYMDHAYCEARLYGWSREPIVEMLIPSTLDDSLAPPGAHVASLFCQHTAYDLPAGLTWADCREEVADLMIATVDRYAPGFAAMVVGRQLLSPVDLENTFGLVGGDIFHGVMGLDQLFSARPLPRYAAYRGPIAGLYHCGSGSHPGGGVTGAPGHNAAKEILRDLKGASRP